MTNLIRKMFYAGAAVSLLVACSKESVSEDMTLQSVDASTIEIQDPTANDLIGRWNMYSMTSIGDGNSVDFDQDGNFTYDLLEETDCFDSMYFLFDNEGNVTTEQARLFFNGTTGQFTCQTTGNYAATYQISGDQLTVTFTVDGVQYTETKTVSLYNENGIDYLKVTLTEAETDSAVYVSNDPGNTVASDIKQIDMVYKKVQ